MISSKLKKGLVISLICCLFAIMGVIGILGMSNSPVYAAAEESYNFVMKNGASVRTGEDNINAIRFVSYIQKSELDELMSAKQSVRVQTMITPTRYLENSKIADKDFTRNTLDEKEVKYTTVIFSQSNNNLTNLTTIIDDVEYYEFRACLYDIQEHNIAKAFSARSFLEVDSAIVQYTDYSTENNSRSIYYVAKAAKEDGNTDAKVAALCSDYTVTISSEYTAEQTLTVKRGENLSEYANSDTISSLNIDHLAYVKGYLNSKGEQYDMTTPITDDLTLTARYSAVRFGMTDDTACVTGVDSDYTNYTTIIVIPSTYLKKTVTYIAAEAFNGKKGIQKIVLPETVTALKGSVFLNCSDLVYVAMPGVTALTESANGINNFLNCDNLAVVVVGDQFTTDSQQFLTLTSEHVAATNIYVKGTSIGTLSGSNNLLAGNTYYQGTQCGQWSYIDGFATIAHMEHNYVDGVCEYCGASVKDTVDAIAALPEESALCFADIANVKSVYAQYAALSDTAKAAVSNGKKIETLYAKVKDITIISTELVHGGQNQAGLSFAKGTDTQYGEYVEITHTSDWANFKVNVAQAPTGKKVVLYVYSTKDMTLTFGTASTIYDSSNAANLHFTLKANEWTKIEIDWTYAYQIVNGMFVSGNAAGDYTNLTGLKFSSTYIVEESSILDDLVPKKDVTELVEKIAALPETENVTLAHVTTIKTLYNEYAALTSAEKANVTNATKLTGLYEKVKDISITTYSASLTTNDSANGSQIAFTEGTDETYGGYAQLTHTASWANFYVNVTEDITGKTIVFYVYNPLDREITLTLGYLNETKTDNIFSTNGTHFTLASKGWTRIEVKWDDKNGGLNLYRFVIGNTAGDGTNITGMKISSAYIIDGDVPKDIQ